MSLALYINEYMRSRVWVKSKLLKGFADESRLAILESLAGGPRPVGEIVRRTRLSQPLVSMHLACMRC